MQAGTTFNRVMFDSGSRHRKTVDTPMTLEYSFFLSKRQMQEFLNFYHVTLGRGVEQFYAVWEVNGFIEPKYFKFSKAFTVTAITVGLYKVQTSFEMMTTSQGLINNQQVIVLTDFYLEIFDDSGDIITVGINDAADVLVLDDNSVIITTDSGEQIVTF